MCVDSPPDVMVEKSSERFSTLAHAGLAAAASDPTHDNP